MVRRLPGVASGRLWGWVWLGGSLAVYGSVLISPGVFWPAQIIGFGIPCVMLANLLGAALLLWLRRYRQAAFPLISLIPAIWFLPATLQVPKPGPSLEGKPSLKVVSFNMASLAGKRSRMIMKRRNARQMMAWIQEQKADLLVLQEFYQNNAVPEYTPIGKLKANGYRSVLFSNKKEYPAREGYGVAIVSRFPLKNGKVWSRQLATNNQIMTAELEWQGQTYRVLNVHLQSNRLTWGEIGIKRPPEELKRNFFSILAKMRLAAQKRAEQVALVCRLIDESPYPVLLAGDFNDTPYSYTYWQINRRLRNSFEKAGRGFGFTYNFKLPGLRIDHQFYSPSGLECVRYTTHRDVDLSDHFPVSGVYISSDQR